MISDAMDTHEPDRIKPTVLYIEDDPPSIALVKTLLAHHARSRLVVATTGEEGLRLAREQAPALILLDLHLPDIEGTEVLDRLKAVEQTREIPVVAVTAENSDDKPMLRQLPVKDFICKPLDDIPLFIRTVEQGLNGTG